MPIKEIHFFAIEWLNKYCNVSTTELELETGFADQCFTLGFSMDRGAALDNAYPNVYALYTSEALQSIINEIVDIPLLGSAIFSKWRYITHWAEQDLLEQDNKEWFLCALSRLVTLTDMDSIDKVE